MMTTDEAVRRVRDELGPWLLLPRFRRARPEFAVPSWGCCYVAAEAVRWLSVEKLTPQTVRVGDVVHWYLVRPGCGPGRIVDPTEDQFPMRPDYRYGRGRGFLTSGLSKRAKLLVAKVLETRDR